MKYRIYAFTTILIIYSSLIFAFYSGYNWIIPESILPGFIDLRAVTESCDCYNMGYNPYFEINKFCKWTYNYPKIWIDLTNILNLKGKDTYLIGFFMILLFMITVINLFDFTSRKQVFGLVLIMLSPPVLLLLERANIDIFIFSFAAFAIFYLRKMKENMLTIHISYLILIVCSVLKIYPIFLFGIILIDKISLKSKILIVTYTILIIGSYFFFHLEEIKIILKNTPKPSELAFGKNVFLQEFIKKTYLPLVSIIPFLIITTYLYIKRKWYFTIFQMFDFTKLSFKLFFGGSLLFLGTYFFGNNWDYRLSFIFFLLPFIYELSNENQKLRNFKTAFFGLLFVVLLTSFIHRSGFFFHTYSQWFIGRNILMVLKHLSITFYCSFTFLLVLYLLKNQFSSKNRNTIHSFLFKKIN